MSDFVKNALAKLAIVCAFIFCLAMSAVLTWGYFVAHRFGNDFGVYWRAANQPLGEVYFWPGTYAFPYAPTMLLWIKPLVFVSAWPAYLLFVALSVCLYVLSIRPYLPKAAIALCLISPPFLRGMFTGQVCALLSALLFWAVGTERRIAAGITLGIIASIKPQLVLMAPLMLILNRDWRAFISAGSTFLATVILSLIAFGPERWPEWLNQMGHFRSVVTETNIVGIGISSGVIAARYGFAPLPFMLLGAIVGAALVYLCRNAPTLEKTTAIALGSILAAPYALIYDLTAVLPFLALAVMRGRILAGLAAAAALNPLPIAISIFELGWLTTKDRRRSPLDALPHLAQSG